MTNQRVSAVVARPRPGAPLPTLYAGTVGGGVFEFDPSTGWTSRSRGLASFNVSALQMLANTGDGSVRLFASTFDGGVFTSLDAGITWQASNGGLTDLQITAMSLGSPDALFPWVYAGSRSGLIFGAQVSDMRWSWLNPGNTGHGMLLSATVHPGPSLVNAIYAGWQLGALLVQGEPKIDTVAGNGQQGFSGDGGSAKLAMLHSPGGVAVDGQGNLFIADTGNNRIRRVDGASHLISTVAGTGDLGYSGDGGPATNARLGSPAGVAVDAAGNLFIADRGNNRIRRVDGATHVISTVAGTGVAGYSGDGGDATSATLDNPNGVAVGSDGSLYIADMFNSVIRAVDPGGAITTFAGNGNEGFSGDGGPATSAQLFLPGDVAVDPAGNLFIADSFNARVRRVDLSGTITTVVGKGSTADCGDGGPATSACLRPRSVAVSPSGLYLYVSDTVHNRIRLVDLVADSIKTVAGTGSPGFNGNGIPAAAAKLYSPGGVAVHPDNLYTLSLFVADAGNNRVRIVK